MSLSSISTRGDERERERERYREEVMQRTKEQIDSRRAAPISTATSAPVRSADGRVSYGRHTDLSTHTTTRREREREREREQDKASHVSARDSTLASIGESRDTHHAAAPANTSTTTTSTTHTPRERPPSAAPRSTYTNVTSRPTYRHTDTTHTATHTSQPSYSDASTDVARWSPDRVQKWLVQNGMAKHGPLFARNEVNGATLCALTPADLIDELRIASLSERKVLMKLIRRTVGVAAAAEEGGGGGGGGGGAGFAELAQQLETETAMVQAVIQSESRRAHAALHHDIATLTSAVDSLRIKLDLLIEHNVPPPGPKPKVVPYPD